MEHRILIVDDEEIVRERVAHILHSKGNEVLTADSGERAISLMEKNFNFDLVITDLRLPGMDGLELLKNARDIDPDVSVILITAYPDVSVAVDCLRLGADDFVQKPFERDDLLVRAKNCLEKRELKRKVRMYEELLTICGYCHKIKGDESIMLEGGHPKWYELAEYLELKAKAKVSHGVCPGCYKEQFG